MRGVFNPSACTEEVQHAIWRAYVGVAACVNNKQDEDMEDALNELKRLLGEHAQS